MTARVAWAALCLSLYCFAVLVSIPGHGGDKPIQATYPLYGANVSDGTYPLKDGRDLERRVADLERHVADLQGKPAAKGPASPDYLPLMSQFCARCHTPGTAPSLGEGFVMFADDEAKAFSPMTPNVQRLVRQMISDGSMPKRGAKPTKEQKTFLEKFELKN